MTTKRKTVKSDKKPIIVPPQIKKKFEFETFIRMVRDGVPFDSWKNMAIELGIDEDTLVKWKKTSEYLEARTNNIEEVIKKMKEAGGNDWRMWDRQLKLMGIDAVEKVDLTSGGRPLSKLLDEIDGDTTGLSGTKDKAKG